MSENPVFTLLWTFGLMSLFAVGGALSALPEMHRYAVEIHHWMTDQQFADMVAIAQLSPGPNVLVVTLIGFHVAGHRRGAGGDFGDVRATAIVAYVVSTTIQRAQRIALAGDDPVRAGSDLDRADGGQRNDFGDIGRPFVDRRCRRYCSCTCDVECAV